MAEAEASAAAPEPVPEAAESEPQDQQVETPVQEPPADLTAEPSPGRQRRAASRRRKIKGGRTALVGIAEALARAEDPTLAELPGADEAIQALAALQREIDARREAAPPIEAPVEAAVTDAPAAEAPAAEASAPETLAAEEPSRPEATEAPEELAVASAQVADDMADIEQPDEPELYATVSMSAVSVPATSLVADEDEPADLIDEPEPTSEVMDVSFEAVGEVEEPEQAAPEPPHELVAAPDSPYSTEVVEPDWFADGDFTWLEAAQAEATQQAPAPARRPSPSLSPSLHRRGSRQRSQPSHLASPSLTRRWRWLSQWSRTNRQSPSPRSSTTPTRSRSRRLRTGSSQPPTTSGVPRRRHARPSRTRSRSRKCAMPASAATATFEAPAEEHATATIEAPAGEAPSEPSYEESAPEAIQAAFDEVETDAAPADTAAVEAPAEEAPASTEPSFEEPAREAIQEAFSDPVMLDAPAAEAVTPEGGAHQQEDQPQVDEAGALGGDATPPSHAESESPDAPATSPPTGPAGEEELMRLGDEFEEASLEIATQNWRSADAARSPAEQTVLELSDAELSQLAEDEGWDTAEVEAIRSLLGRAAPAPARAQPDLPEPPVMPANAAEPRPAPRHSMSSMSDPQWLQGRRGPAATAYRRLRRLFPG